MKRVASLYLPDWPIERIVQATQAGRTASPPEAAAATLDPLGQRAGAEAGQPTQSPASRGGGWRPGARWARGEQAVPVSQPAIPQPAHAQPPRPLLGRRSEAAAHPFRPMGPDEGRSVVPTTRGRGRTTMPDRAAEAAHVPAHSPPWKGGAGGGSLAVERSPRSTTTHPLPSKEGGPLVTSLQQGSALLVAAAAPAARALGIRPGMAITQARALVPGLDIRASDPDGDRAALMQLALLAARRWCPAVALSKDRGAGDAAEDWGLLLDISGTAHLFGGEAAMARRIVRLLARAGFSAHVAIADTAGAAWALARHRTTRHSHDDKVTICLPGQQIDALAPLPVAALRLEPAAVELLRRLGVETIGALAALPRAPLARRFGGNLVARLDQATGRRPEPLDPVVPQERIVVAQRFAEPIATAEAIAHWIGVLLPQLVTALAQAGLGARVIELVADRIDGVPQRLRIGLARPTRDGPHLLRLIVRRIEEIAPGYGIDSLALYVRRADPLSPAPFAQNLTAPQEETAPDLAPLVDTLANRIGLAALWRTRPVESDVPERCVAATDPLDPPERASPPIRAEDVRRLDQRALPHAWDARWPRPVRLLRRPEPIDDVLALLPDQPPRRFTWRGHTHRVVRADGPERIHGEWWKRASEAHSVRDYFRVEDEAGARFWLFRRGDGERAETGDLAWFMHGSFG